MLTVPAASPLSAQLPTRGYLVEAYARKASTDAWLADQRREDLQGIVDARFAGLAATAANGLHR
jgi:hypothetical protein